MTLEVRVLTYIAEQCGQDADNLPKEILDSLSNSELLTLISDTLQQMKEETN